METRFIDDAISLLSRAEAKLGNVARSSEDYRFLESLRFTAREAEKELAAIIRGDSLKPTQVHDAPEPMPLECFCNADNAPCNWCESHCVECEEEIDECTCETTP